MEDHGKHSTAYRKLALMSALSFVTMFALMYAMVDRLANVYPHVNQIYMAGLMTAAMVVIELLVMRAMYHDRRRNAVIGILSAVALVVLFLLIRRQVAVGDEQFLKSMIPHHSSAILMCRQATITDPGIENLCDRIVSSQQSEIDEMKAMLETLR